MILGITHKGSGLGNQLFRLVTTRILAEEKGYKWSMIAPELFKGMFFTDLDLGMKTDIPYTVEEPSEKTVADIDFPIWQEWDKHCYDPDINFVQDNTIIDGNFEDEKYFGHKLDEIRDWLKVKPLNVPDDVCIINFRGGEYQYIPELFLPESYWEEAIRIMQKSVPQPLRFEVHTDDPALAAKFFPNLQIFQNMELNWRSIRYAKYLILSNSSFAVLPSLLNENAELIIAPRYWNRYNVKRWDYPQGYYKKFMYI